MQKSLCQERKFKGESRAQGSNGQGCLPPRHPWESATDSSQHSFEMGYKILEIKAEARCKIC